VFFPNHPSDDAMSRRGRANGSPISLFSFQDIITSVTAIMILLVLILTLELIARLNLKGVATEDHLTAVELDQSIDALRERVTQLQSQTKNVRDTARRVAAQSVPEIDAERRAVQRQCEDLRKRIDSLEPDAREAGMKRRNAEQELVEAGHGLPDAVRVEQQGLRDQAAAMALEQQNTAESTRQKDRERDLQDAPQSVSTLVFNPAKGLSLKPILIELTDHGVAVMGDHKNGVHRYGWGLLGPSSDFVNWLAARDSSREYIVIMLRPSGLDRLEPTRQAVYDAGLELGLELVGGEMDIVLAEDFVASTQGGGQGAKP